MGMKTLLGSSPGAAGTYFSEYKGRGETSLSCWAQVSDVYIRREEGNWGLHLNTLMYMCYQRCGLGFLIGGLSKNHMLLNELNWREGDAFSKSRNLSF